MTLGDRHMFWKAAKVNHPPGFSTTFRNFRSFATSGLAGTGIEWSNLSTKDIYVET